MLVAAGEPLENEVGLDETALVTLGIGYERVPRFGGGAYHPILRRLPTFTDQPLRTAALKDHERRTTMVLDLEKRVAAAVRKFKTRGLVSPYLRWFVVARINPLRWIKGEGLPSKRYQNHASAGGKIQRREGQAASSGGRPDRRTRKFDAT